MKIANIIDMSDISVSPLKVPMFRRAIVPLISEDGLVGDVGTSTSPTRHGPEGAREAEG